MQRIGRISVSSGEYRKNHRIRRPGQEGLKSKFMEALNGRARGIGGLRRALLRSPYPSGASQWRSASLSLAAVMGFAT